MGRIACIDFGKARFGIAISDERRVIATPLETIESAKNYLETSKRINASLSRYKEIDLVVIGLPLLLNGKEGEMAILVRAFGQVLGQVLPYPIVFWDERLTSAGVDKMLLAMDVSRKKRAQLSDALSAVSILQNYLDSLIQELLQQKQ